MKTDSTKVLWQVQARKSRAHKWVNKGRFEVRSAARRKASDLRHGTCSVPDGPGRIVTVHGATDPGTRRERTRAGSAQWSERCSASATPECFAW